MTDQQVRGSSGSSLSRYAKVLIGVCFIFGISGIFFWWKGKLVYMRINEKLLGLKKMDR
jgi:hypothetical protein